VNGANQGALIVFAREPRGGRVKTRLASAIGAPAAAAVYARLLDRTLDLAEHSRFGRCYLYCADSDERAYFDSRLVNRRWTVRSQSGGDLGERMLRAFQDVLAEHSHAILIGSDIADCTAADLETAREILTHNADRAVLGPVVDGGYWLIGLRTADPSWFADIPWSTCAVAALTRAALMKSGLRVVELEPRFDIDEAGDLRRLLHADEGA